MAQINLLKQKTDQNLGHKLPGLISKLLMVVLLFVVVYYGWLFIRIKNVNAKTLKLQEEISATKRDALALKGRDELLVRQKQLAELDKVLSAHAYYSELFKSVAGVMLKSAQITSVKAGGQNELVMTIGVPSLEDLDKFLQIFDHPKFNENFTSVRVGAFAKIKSEETTTYRFDLRMKFNPENIKAKALSN